MTIFITLTTAQADTGPFNLFSNLDYTSAIAMNVTKAQLLAGYSISNAPNGTISVRVISLGNCKNYIDIPVTGVATTTTTTSPPNMVYRVSKSCCTPPDNTERYSNISTLGNYGPTATFTGNDGFPYTILSTVTVPGTSNVTQSPTDSTIYDSCSSWISIFLGCPGQERREREIPATTTTTTTQPVMSKTRDK